MILKNISILYGTDLKFIESTDVKITNKKFQKISPRIISRKEKILNCKGLLLIPGLINSHTHIGDSIGKDVSLDSNVDSRIHPVSGIKQKILTETPKKELAKFIRKSATSMLRKGTTTFVDFREGGIEGIQLLKDALKGNPIRSIILGRIDYYQTKGDIQKNTPMPEFYKSELKSLLRNCDGVGISGPNENSNSNLDTYSKIKKLRAIHAAETMQSYSTSQKISKSSEPVRALLLKPTFLVHMTFATKNIYVPAACHLARGGTMEIIGTEIADFEVKSTELKAVIEKDMIRGVVIYVDAYGNAITNISKEVFEGVQKGRNFSILFGREDEQITIISAKYKEVPPSEKLAIFGENNLLQIAMNQGKANKLLGLNLHEIIRIEFILF